MVVATLLSLVKFLRVDKVATEAVSIEFLNADGTTYTANFAAAAVPATIAALIAGGGRIGCWAAAWPRSVSQPPAASSDGFVYWSLDAHTDHLHPLRAVRRIARSTDAKTAD